ncbi:MAG: NAD-dependent dehydratase [Undibacterium sp.]|uniref:NAD-dependent epimerase/dehydratase family protein n=1 Tax=Undibacterium sp. TaxID=1914977 RepID=UPI002719536C|nr:NAD-dependent epimerase/dehydratase family protein [Undibacterium sp.]MDO8652459.1 NAD-dependent dehydratase [Undibacterium sp.]
MIVGRGMLANAFTQIYLSDPDTWIYASGVSNSVCTDDAEFLRERSQLSAVLADTNADQTFVYFGTCSVADPSALNTPYVQHKLAMEKLVTAHPGHLIFRLPQIAGKTNNPHTLLNTLHRHAVTGEEFPVWRNAFRNIIDIDDVVTIVMRYVGSPLQRQLVLNVANPECSPIGEIVKAMEHAMGRKMRVQMIERGTHYPIDVTSMLNSGFARDCIFDENYLERVISKYHAQ